MPHLTEVLPLLQLASFNQGTESLVHHSAHHHRLVPIYAGTLPQKCMPEARNWCIALKKCYARSTYLFFELPNKEITTKLYGRHLGTGTWKYLARKFTS